MNIWVKGILLRFPVNNNNSNEATKIPIMNPAKVPLINGNASPQPSSIDGYKKPITMPIVVIQVNCFNLYFWLIVSFTILVLSKLVRLTKMV